MVIDTLSEPLQCFTSIQSRKAFGDVDSLQLCPSMDLVLFSMSATRQQQLHRTVSWNKIATIAPGDDIVGKGGRERTSTACWSPSGRWIVVAENAKVSLYDVEKVANRPIGSTFGSANTEADYMFQTSEPVQSLSWAHVGRRHPDAWIETEEEHEEDVSWQYQKEFSDSANFFLPPSQYLVGDDDIVSSTVAAARSALPDSKTPLSILCISTSRTVTLHVHGRYPLVELNRPPSMNSEPSAVVGNDLSFLLLQCQNRLSLYRLPFLREDRYPIQVMASLHASITSHLQTLQQSILEIAGSWRASLKPLDTKLQPMLKLLRNYGVDDQPPGVLLKQYILVGHTSESSSLANAMDQFFTSVQMNDQLLQRMIRSLHGALANAEAQARQRVRSPAQALCRDIQELSSQIRYHSLSGSSPEALDELLKSSAHLWLRVESLIQTIVHGRSCVRDLCGWLRSAGAQVKARGTAVNSVQRENAKKRRVPQAVLKRLLSNINTATMDGREGSFSEYILNIQVSYHLDSGNDPSGGHNVAASMLENPDGSTKCLVHIRQSIEDAAARVFQNPLSNIPLGEAPIEFSLPRLSQESPLVAIHSRIGSDLITFAAAHDLAENEAANCFCPKICQVGATRKAGLCRQWAVLAQAHSDKIQLFAIPITPSEIAPHSGQEPPVKAAASISYYLSSLLEIPPGGIIQDIQFYSDDGKSSLAAGNNSGSGKEGKQNLGLLYYSGQDLELWMVDYDQLVWQSIEFSESLADTSNLDPACIKRINPLLSSGEVDAGEFDMWVRTRTIASLEVQPERCALHLCGSRGVGAVSIQGAGTTTIEVLDLEEDEEDSEHDDGEDETDDF